MNTVVSKITAMLLGAGMALSAGASTIDFSYNTSGLETKVYGFDKRETYDIAIFIDDEKLVGSTIKGFSVYVGSSGGDDVTDVKGWLSSSLTLEKGRMVPDIEEKEAALHAEYSTLDVSFDTPHAIPSEGIYVGYTFTVAALNDYTRYPVACIESTENTDKGLFIHSSRSRLQWENTGQAMGLVSTMTVTVEGDFGEMEVRAALDSEYFIARGEEGSFCVNLTNMSSERIDELSYSLTAGDTMLSGDIILEEPIPGQFGLTARTSVPLPVFQTAGALPLSFVLTGVNGHPFSGETCESVLNVMPFMPVSRPLIEEYSGLNCGYCPRGYVALETMKETLGDRYVALSYHSQSYERGAMVTLHDDEFPVAVGGFPYSTVNRGDGCDPSLLHSVWSRQAEEITPADIEVSLKWSDSGTLSLVAQTSVRFVKDYDDSCFEIGYAIAADNLSDARWRQLNNFAGQTGEEYDSDLWRIFTEGERYVQGLVFNDIAAYCRDIGGVGGSLPAYLEADTNYNHTYNVDFADIVNIDGEEFLTEGCRLKCVAFIIDRNTGRIVNSNVSDAIGMSSGGVEVTDFCDRLPVSSRWFTLQGIELDRRPDKGLYVRIDFYDDGSCKTLIQSAECTGFE